MQVLIDLKEVAAGSLEEDWDMLEPKKIKVGPGYARGRTDTQCGMSGWWLCGMYCRRCSFDARSSCPAEANCLLVGVTVGPQRQEA